MLSTSLLQVIREDVVFPAPIIMIAAVKGVNHYMVGETLIHIYPYNQPFMMAFIFMNSAILNAFFVLGDTWKIYS